MVLYRCQLKKTTAGFAPVGAGASDYGRRSADTGARAKVGCADGYDMEILVACMGNLLRGDDGFGVAVADALRDRDFPPSVDVVEVGISGVSMAQELLDDYDAFVLVDAMETGGDPGTVSVSRASVPDIDQYSDREIASFAADMHQTDPSKILVLGEALGVLPDVVVVVGCEPTETDELTDRLSRPVREAVPEGADQVERIVDELVHQ